MKVVILAGGLGTRLSEETDVRPKPMVEIGGYPIIWHIMKIYSYYGFNEFIILLGYKGNVIKNFFLNYHNTTNDMTINLLNNDIELHGNSTEPWKVTLIDTGIDTMTGGRIKKAASYIDNKPFLLTYGDGLIDANIKKIVEFHLKNKKSVTITAVQAEGRYGSLNINNNDLIESFEEKPKGDGAWINGGFFVCNPDVLDYIKEDNTVFEEEPLMNLAISNKMLAWRHKGFWQAMDTLRDKNKLNYLWKSNKALWKKWE
jgi:glucose-1-phosphate cytidylyltransferase